ncbi:MAG: DUF3617 family protein [Phreatobacter sp.]|uniref:DUF3617 domain-containing protein n=1 Tax=Phreatobacter sp. TaxID=1966341 RepID=UPI001A52B60F|nr:DUF3617 family protein [Phreatobacter sp.]MBL8567494.1 DUF3617 family protein [Phreatobacter sp.]
MHAAPLAVLAALIATPAFAQTPSVELPSRRAGQWEIKTLMEGREGGPEMVAQTCTDAATERQMMQLGMGMAGQVCQRYDIRRVGQEYHIETDCQMGPMRSVSRSVMSGDFQSSYSVRIEGAMTMPGQSQPQATNMVQNARWVGAACTGGLVPGDIQTMGQKVNIRNMPGFGGGTSQPRRP